MHVAGAATGIGAMLLAANAVISSITGGYFDAAAETNPLLHTWSLSVEEQFYLAFPAILAIGWVIARRRRSRATAQASTACSSPSRRPSISPGVA